MVAVRRIRILLIATSALLAGCMHPRAIEAPEGVQLTPLKTISTFKARVLLTLSGVDGISVEQRGRLLSDAVPSAPAARPFN